MATLRDTIKGIVKTHLVSKLGRCYGQCLTAVGWVGGTLPEMYEEDGMVELSMADVTAGGILTGAALAGERPIFVVRYQGFQWYNAPTIVNYAAKSKELWGRPCPIFIRSIAMEGGMGPVAGSSHHSIYHRMPGIKIVSPMTPGEYEAAYNSYIHDDDVYYISEHRGSFDNTLEFSDTLHTDSDIVIFPISITRFEAEKARVELERDGLKVSIVHQCWLKPYRISQEAYNILSTSRFGGLVLDDDYVEGVASHLAYELMLKSGKKVLAVGLEPKTAGFSKESDNLPPNKEKIVSIVKEMVK